MVLYGDEKEMKHICSYCGGWDDGIPDDPNLPNVNPTLTSTAASAVNLDFHMGGIDIERRVCIKCLKEGLDKLFGGLKNETNSQTA